MGSGLHPLPFSLLFEERLSMNMVKKKNKKSDIQSRIIRKKTEEIESLKEMISELEIDSAEKDNIINSIDSFRDELSEIADDLKNKREEYDKLIKELIDMKKIMNEEVFKNRWNLVRLLLK